MTSRYEPISNIDEEYRNSCFPVELLQGIHNSYRVEYDKCSLVFAQKDFHMAKQFFVRYVCRYNLPATEVFKVIDQVKKVVNERLWVSDLVGKKLFIKFSDIVRDWALQNMIVK